MLEFKKARRAQSRLRLALSGPSGSGKTYSALSVAMGLVGPSGRIAVIDTERGSASLYADLCDFETLQLGPPYSPARYVEAIRAAESAGFDCLVVDSLSHAWVGEGGVLSMHDAATRAQRAGNSFTAWREVTPAHNMLVDAILASPLHIIGTLRTKTAYEIAEDDKGKKAPKRVGLAPVQREGLEYEFTTVLDLDVDSHLATASKDRTRLFGGTHVRLAVEHGEALRAWLDSGVDEWPAMEAALQEAATDLPTLQGQFARLWQSADASMRPRLKSLYDGLKADLGGGAVDERLPGEAPATLEERARARAARLRPDAPTEGAA